MYPKNVSVTTEVDGVALEGYGTYYIRDYAGVTNSKRVSTVGKYVKPRKKLFANIN